MICNWSVLEDQNWNYTFIHLFMRKKNKHATHGARSICDKHDGKIWKKFANIFLIPKKNTRSFRNADSIFFIFIFFFFSDWELIPNILRLLGFINNPFLGKFYPKAISQLWKHWPSWIDPFITPLPLQKTSLFWTLYFQGSPKKVQTEAELYFKVHSIPWNMPIQPF